MDDVLLCKDCKHLTLGDKCAKMRRPIDFISGAEMGYYSAQLAREHDTSFTCGPSARWWEQK